MKSLSLIVCLILTVVYVNHVEAVTDAELEALEKQIEQQEAEEKKQAETAEKKKAEAEAKLKVEQKRKAEEEKRLAELEKQRQAEEQKKLEEQKRFEEEKRKVEEARLTELERQRTKEEERLRAEKEKYDSHIKKADAYMDEEKYNQAIEEYEQLLKFFPDDISVNEGIKNAHKLLNSCKEIVGSWQLSHGPTWVINDDNTADGAWLIFNTKGLWECLSAREREFVVSWIGYDSWTLHFKLSEDTNTLNPTRANKTISGIRIDDIKKDSAASIPTL